MRFLKATKVYPFTTAGVKSFYDNTIDDIFTELEKPDADMNQFDIVVTIGSHRIKIPCCADGYDAIITALTTAAEEV